MCLLTIFFSLQLQHTHTQTDRQTKQQNKNDTKYGEADGDTNNNNKKLRIIYTIKIEQDTFKIIRCFFVSFSYQHKLAHSFFSCLFLFCFVF